jgi:WD40 repeat protein
LPEHLHLNTITISPDRKWVATATWQGRGIRVWDGATGQSVVELLPDASSASVRFSPNGQWLAASDGSASYLWQTGTWQLLHTLPREHPDGWPGPVAFSPDSRMLAIAHSRYVVELIEPFSGKTLAVLEAPHRESLDGCAFSSDSTRLAISEETRVQLWDLTELRHRLQAMTLDWDTPSCDRRAPMAEDQPMGILLEP